MGIAGRCGSFVFSKGAIAGSAGSVGGLSSRSGWAEKGKTVNVLLSNNRIFLPL